jgi:hypothetical protein
MPILVTADYTMSSNQAGADILSGP